jgi:hypothetical protein
MLKCVICKGSIEPDKTPDGQVYWEGGHSAQPIADGRCCNNCNDNVVLTARLKQTNTV